MMTIGGVTVDSYISPPTLTHRFRARSVIYALDGTAKEDRLGGTKKLLTLPFAVISSDTWESLRAIMERDNFLVAGNVGGADVSGTFRLSGNDIPTPILYVDRHTHKYMCQPFTVVIEEV